MRTPVLADYLLSGLMAVATAYALVAALPFKIEPRILFAAGSLTTIAILGVLQVLPAKDVRLLLAITIQGIVVAAAVGRNR